MPATTKIREDFSEGKGDVWILEGETVEKVKKMIDKMRNSLSLQTQKGINAYGICGSDPLLSITCLSNRS